MKKATKKGSAKGGTKRSYVGDPIMTSAPQAKAIKPSQKKK